MPGTAARRPRGIRRYLPLREKLRWCYRVRKETPFHSAIKACHHARSDRNATLRRIGTRSRGGLCPACRRSIIRRRKERPAITTLQAWLSIPTRDSRSLREHTLQSPRWRRRAWSLCSFSPGRRSCPATVSIFLMPRNTRHVVGPSVLCSAIGPPNSPHS